MNHIPVAQPLFLGNEKKYVMDCLDTGWISSKGNYIEKFEREFANYIGVKHAITCTNGTVALHLALLAYDVKAGDEIIVPNLTYIATANAVSYCGAKPILVDSEPGTWNIDPNLIEKKITANTKGIIVVHLYGHPAEMDSINALAKKYNLFVIEDAAEAHGAKYKNKNVGSLADIATFSFFGNKIITTGEGGMITLNDDQIAEKIRLLKGQGMDPKRQYWFPSIGYNYRMTNIQAAIGLAQLETIKKHLQLRQEIAEHYFQQLSNIDEISFPEKKPYVYHPFWMFSISLKVAAEDATQPSLRDQLMMRLAEDNIETRPIFHPLHHLPPYAETQVSYKIAEKIAATSLNLPTFSSLNKAEIQRICRSVVNHLTREKQCVSS